MPNIDPFPFDPSEVQTALYEKINGAKSCPYCGCKDFSLFDEVGIIHKTKVWGRVDIEKVMPLAMLMCDNCGHVAMFSFKLFSTQTDTTNEE